QVRRAIGQGADVEEAADMRVIQRGDGPRLTLEAPIELLRGKLDRDLAAQARVQRPIDLAHATCAKTFFNAVRAELCAHDCRSGPSDHSIRSGPYRTRIDSWSRRALAGEQHLDLTSHRRRSAFEKHVPGPRLQFDGCLVE